MRRLLALPLLFCAFSPISADPGPGDVFREYLWKGPWENASGWQRVTDPQAAAEGGHAGTSAKRLRLDDHDWIAVPEPAAIPGDAGRKPVDDPQCYQYFTYPSVPVPLEQLSEGENVFEFTSGPPQTALTSAGASGAFTASPSAFTTTQTAPIPTAASPPPPPAAPSAIPSTWRPPTPAPTAPLNRSTSSATTTTSTTRATASIASGTTATATASIASGTTATATAL